MKSYTLILITYGWPSRKSGYGIALYSSLKQYLNLYNKIYYIAIIDQKFKYSNDWKTNKIIWNHIFINRKKKLYRFLISLFSQYPAVSQQYRHKFIKKEILKIILEEKNISNNKINIIFEGIAPSSLLIFLRKKFKSIPIGIRSHDIISKAFSEMQNSGNLFIRLAWNIEVLKMKKLEKKVYNIADKFWAITKSDAKNYMKQYNIKTDGVFGISINKEWYKSIEKGDIYNIIYLGSSDLLKGDGLKNFIINSWLHIYKTLPEAKFIIAGRNTEKYNNKKYAIIGKGYCEEEQEILNKGIIFINPQKKGTGIQLKSCIAMLTGKVLVSTTVGLQGIPGKDGVHFYKADRPNDFIRIIIKIIKNKNKVLKIGCKARSIIIKTLNEKKLSSKVKPLIEDLQSL